MTQYIGNFTGTIEEWKKLGHDSISGDFYCHNNQLTTTENTLVENEHDGKITIQVVSHGEYQIP